MAEQRKLKAVKSIQATPKRGGKRSSTRDLQDRSLRGATHHGLPWSDDEVARLVSGIERDETSFEMALAVGRSYYSTMSARSKVAFALRHANVLLEPIRKESRRK